MKNNDKTEMQITNFRGKYFYLSNFYPCEVKYEGITYKNAEAAFQAQKVLADEEKLPFAELEPRDAKKLGKKVPLRKDWEKVKVEIMYSVVRAKFEQNDDLRQQLCDTGDAQLAERNTWNDTFWGIDADSGIGENYLGRILMKLREMFAEIESYRFKLSWQFCIGNANDMISGEHKAPDTRRTPASADSWSTNNTPPKYAVSLPKAIPVTGERMQFLRLGHIPQEMEDHWFMYCDEDSINYFRSWNGTWFFRAKYHEAGEGYEIYELYSHSEDENSSLFPLFMYLMASDCGEYEIADEMFRIFISRDIAAAAAASKYNKFFSEE